MPFWEFYIVMVYLLEFWNGPNTQCWFICLQLKLMGSPQTWCCYRLETGTHSCFVAMMRSTLIPPLKTEINIWPSLSLHWMPNFASKQLHGLEINYVKIQHHAFFLFLWNNPISRVQLFWPLGINGSTVWKKIRKISPCPEINCSITLQNQIDSFSSKVPYWK